MVRMRYLVWIWSIELIGLIALVIVLFFFVIRSLRERERERGREIDCVVGSVFSRGKKLTFLSSKLKVVFFPLWSVNALAANDQPTRVLDPIRRHGVQVTCFFTRF